MTTRFVHALFAAGVENPALITRWREQPALLRDYGIEPGTVDLDALWKFAGLTAKIRHRGLREQLPATFRLLSVTGLEVEVFAAHASARAERDLPLATTNEVRARDLIAFLDGWLDRRDPMHALVWDLIRHERALIELGRRAPAVGSSPNLRSPVRGAGPVATAAAVPRIQGDILLHQMTSDPRRLTAALQERFPELGALPRGPGFHCYWRAEGSPQIAILQLDQLGYRTLALVDGARSAAGVYAGLGGTGRPNPTFLRKLDELETVGVIAFAT
jgi:hypothetical protein